MPSFCTRSAKLTIYSSVTDLPPEWDQLLGEGHPMHSAALAVYEKIQLPDVQLFYALYGSPSEGMAVAYFQRLKIQAKHLNQGLLSSWQSTIVPLCVQVLQPTVLVAGHLFRHDTVSFYAKPGMDNLDAFRAYEAMIQAVAKKSHALAILIKDVNADLVPYFQNYAPHYALLRQDISMEMQIPERWNAFADYEAAIKHKYAQKLRKVQQGIEHLSIRNLSEQEVFDQKAKIYQLYAQVSNKQVFTLGSLNEDFLPVLKQFYGDKLQIWGFYEGDEMIAFASAWIHEACFDMFYIGFDYDKNQKYSLYFNILYFSIKQSISYKKPKMNLGRTALEAKARLGCKPRYLPTFLHIRNVCLRAMVNGRLQTRHEEEGAWEQRHPFRHQ